MNPFYFKLLRAIKRNIGYAYTWKYVYEEINSWEGPTKDWYFVGNRWRINIEFPTKYYLNIVLTSPYRGIYEGTHNIFIDLRNLSYTDLINENNYTEIVNRINYMAVRTQQILEEKVRAQKELQDYLNAPL